MSEDDDDYTNVDVENADDHEREDDDSSSSDSEESQSRPGASINYGGDDNDTSGTDSDESSDDSYEEFQINEPKILEQHSSGSNSKSLTLNLMKRTRRLISMIHHSSIIEKYFHDHLSLKRQELTQRSSEDANENFRFDDLLIDMRVR